MLARDPLGETAGARGGAPARRALFLGVGVVTLLGTALRLASLRALPVFGDEAFFLRIAILTRKDPASRLWLFFQEGQAPLHVWLLALFRPLSADPVTGGRLLSAAAGVVSIPAAAWLALRTAEAFGGRRRRDAWVEALAAAALLAVAPFFVFAQRIARLDSLFLLESLLAAGLSVTLAARAVSADSPPLLRGVGFGLLMGITMLTRQAVSYPLWLLPPIVWLLLRGKGSRRPGDRRRLIAALAVAAGVAGLLWIPMLVVPGGPDLMTRLFHRAASRPAMGLGARLDMMLASLGIAGRAFAAYLTLPVLLLGAAGIGVLLAAGRRRCVLYLALWEAILLAPACAFAYGYFPRYALPAAIPILLAAAHGAAFLWAGLAGAVRSGAARTLLATALTVLAVGPSIRDDLRGIRSWRDWPLLPVDRGQFVSGSPAGFATEAAAGWLREAAAAREGPVTVLTPEISGNPTDGVWLLLDGDPRIRLSYAPDALRQPLLPPAGADGARRLPGDARDPRPAPVVVSPGETVFAVAPDPLITRSGWVRAAEFLARSNPGLVEAARFANPVTPGIPPSAVVVLRLPEPSH